MRLWRAVGLGVLAGALFWIIDAALDAQYFYELTFVESALTQVPAHEVYVRLVAFFGFLALSLSWHRRSKSRARMVSALERSAGEWRQTFDTIGDAIFLLDSKGRISRCNAATERILDKPSSEIVGKLCYEAIHGAAEPIPDCPIVRMLESRHRESLVVEVDDRWFDVHVDPILDDRGEVTGAVHIMTDISQQKRAEAVLVEERNSAQRYLDLAGVMFVAVNTAGAVTLINKKGCEILGYEEEEIIGQKWFEHFIPPWLRENLIPVSKALLAGDVEVAEYHENPILTKTGKVRLIAWHNTILTDEAGKIVGHLSSGEDITERREAEEAVARRAAELTAVLEAARALAQLRSPKELSTEIIKVLERCVGYEYAAVLLVDEASGKLIPFALSDRGRGPEFEKKDRQYVASHDIRCGKGIVGWVAAHGEAVRSGNVREDPRYFPMREGIRSELCVPILAGGRVLGVVNVECAGLDVYSEADERVLETVAVQIGVAIQNGYLYEDRLAAEEALRSSADRLRSLRTQMEQAVEEERKRIARELHDQVSQNLTALSINISAAAAALPQQASAPRHRLEESTALIEGTADHLRDLTFDLRPPVLDDFGLVAAIEWHAERTGKQAGLAIQVNGREPDPRLPPQTEMALFRIIQEAMINVVKHARATTVCVQLVSSEESVRLAIEDDGVGFDSERAASRGGTAGWGLLNMRERAESLDGTLALQSSDRGTRITVEVPR